MVSLATASDSLKVWRFSEQSGLTLTSKFAPSTNTLRLSSTPAKQQQVPLQSHMNAIAWNHTNQVIAISGMDSKIYLIQANNGQVLSSLQISESKINSAAVSFSNNSRYLTATLGCKLQLWDLKKRQIKAVYSGHVDDVTATCFTSQGDVVSGDKAGVVRLWDSKLSFHSLADLRTSKTDSVTCVGTPFLGDAVVASGYSNGELCVWDTVTSQLLRSQACHKGSLSCLTYSTKNPRLIATVGSDGKIALIDTSSQQSSGPSASLVLADEPSINSISFHEDAIHSAVGFESGQVMVFDWRNIRRPVATLEAINAAPVRAVAFQVPAGGGSSASSIKSTSSSKASRADTASAVEGPPSTAAVFSTPKKDISSLPPVSSIAVDSTRDTTQGPPSPTLPPSRPLSAMNAPSTATGPLYYVDHEVAAASSTSAPVSSSLLQRTPSVPTASTDHSVVGGAVPVADSITAVIPSSSQAAVGLINSAVVEKQSPKDDSRSAVKSPRSMAPPDNSATIMRNTVDVTKLADNRGATVEFKSSSEQTSQPLSSGNKQFHLERKTLRSSSEIASGLHPHDRYHQLYSSDAAVSPPVTAADLEQSLQLLRLDIHQEVQEIVREQMRQFAIAKDDTAALVRELSQQMAELLKANRELREENEYLRKIY